VWEQGALRVAFDLNSCLGRFEPHEMDRSYAMPPIVIGCDLARAWLDIHALPGGEPSRIGNTRAVIAGWIPGIDPAALVVFEATSGGDGPLIEALAARGIAFARVNPRQAREFARATGILAKTDRVDARVMAEMGSRLPLAATTPPEPDRVRLADLLYDGEVLSLLERTEKLYTRVDLVGTLDELVDALREDYGRPLPAADLILANSYDPLMEDVTDVKDVGVGIVNGVECVHLAFRKEVIDFEIWIAQGDAPYPCRYTVTSKDIPHSPQFTVQVANWMAGDAVVADGFGFEVPAGATMVDLEELREGLSDLPGNFTGDAQ
jgi:hypothetical protein